MGMGMAVVMMGVVVRMGVRHGRTLYYNITGVHVLAAVRQTVRTLQPRTGMG